MPRGQDQTWKWNTSAAETASSPGVLTLPMAGEDASASPSRVVKSREGSDPPPKPKITKSRNGCVTCKAKRLKCDETKPTCLQCKKRNVECGGYKKDFKWKSFEESSFMRSGSRKKGSTGEPGPIPRDVGSPGQPSATPTTSTSGSPATSISTGSLALPSISSATTSPIRQPSSPVIERFGAPAARNVVPYSIATNLSHPFSSSEQRSSGPHSPASTFVPAVMSYHPGFDPSMASPTGGAVLQGFSLDMGRPGLQPSPFNHLQDQGYPGSGMMDDKRRSAGSVDVYPSRPVPALQIQSQGMGLWHTEQDAAHFEYAQSPLSTRSMSVHSMQSVSMEAASLRSPQAAALLNIFVNHTCEIMSMERGEENPWRKTMLPMAQVCPPLMHAILAFTAFWASARNPDIKPHGIEHKAEALRHLGRDMANISATQALATTIALSVAEAFDTSHRLPDHYIVMSRALVHKVLDDIRRGGRSSAELQQSCSILSEWIYMHVLTGLTSKTHHFDGAVVHEILAVTRSMGFSPPVDSCMGIAASLFPFIGRVANLVQMVRSGQASTSDVLPEAENLKRLLTMWGPIHAGTGYGISEEDLDDFKCTAEAFRWAALLVLHQTVPEVSLKSSSQIASRVLKLLAAISHGSRTIVFHLFPLLVAGCEADDKQGRAWVLGQWRELGQRLQVGIVPRCVELTQEVWRRRDGANAGSLGGELQGSMPLGMNFASTGMAPQGQSHMHGLQRSGANTQYADQETDAMFDQIFGQHLMPLQEPAQDFETELLSEEEVLRILSDVGGLDMAQQSVMGGNSIFRQSPDAVETLPFDQTIRGRQNWLGIMEEWGWEIWIA